jgi:uncharacterized protein YprB with RNaseH-like and TPR domain
MLEPDEIFLDVETDWFRRLTVVGFRSRTTGLIQVVGEDIRPEHIRSLLPRAGVLYTYNGHCFDLPVIRDQLGLNLRTDYTSLDLRWICQRHGLLGGQKAIEERIGFARSLPGLDGRDAITLWSRHMEGDSQALEVLLRYNAEDLDGLAAIRDHLHFQGMLTIGAVNTRAANVHRERNIELPSTAVDHGGQRP